MLASVVSLVGLLVSGALSQDYPPPPTTTPPPAGSVTPSQSLAQAIANNTGLTRFGELLNQFPEFLSLVLPTTTTGNVTVLIPNNAAITKAEESAGGSLINLGTDRLISIFKYHVLVAPLTSDNFSAASSPQAATSGLTVPTFLKDELFNNRSAAPELTAKFGPDATGQVIFFQRDPIQDRVLRIRQSVGGGSAGSVSLRSGLAATVNLTTVDGTFSLGRWQVIDSVLTPPANCSSTARNSASISPNLTGLDKALNKAGLWDTLDRSSNVTCLAPTTAAFNAAGNPEDKLDASALTNALLFHTLPLVTYTNFMADGQIIKSLSGELVKITLKDNDIFFNDAKVVAKNVL